MKSRAFVIVNEAQHSEESLIAGNFLLGIVIVLLALSAYTERQAAAPPASEAVQEESGEPLFALHPEEIGAIRVLDAHGCIVVRQKEATPPSVEELIGSIAQARIVRRFSPALVDLSAYGLTRPLRRVEVVQANGAQSRSVVIGNLNPVGNAVYARVHGESDVLLVGSYFLTSLEMALQGLRAKGDVAADPSCVDEVKSPN